MDGDSPRLDVLLYAHDGRGLGHASRTIGVGMALRRLYPGLRVLFVSGCAKSNELIGRAPLDWLKLPSYRTEVVAGKSRGVDGNSGYSDYDLGVLRSRQIYDLVQLYRPRVVLSDHSPQGKHRELVPALECSEATDTRWMLGVRGVVGAVPQATSVLARTLFQKHYCGLLWYGDSAILGQDNIRQLSEWYGVDPVECGYVSRLQELTYPDPVEENGIGRYSCTISVPWLGERTSSFLHELSSALQEIGPEHGLWRLFVDYGDNPEISKEVWRLFGSIEHCRLEPFGRTYVEALLRSRSSLIYGGYNSLVDVLCCNIPTLVILREMKDNEQQIHLEKLLQHFGKGFRVLSESGANARLLRNELLAGLQRKQSCGQSDVNISGAKNSADNIAGILERLRKRLIV